MGVTNVEGAPVLPHFPPLPLEVGPLDPAIGPGGALPQQGLDRAPAKIEFGAF